MFERIKRHLNPVGWSFFGHPRYFRHIPFRVHNGFWPGETWSLDVTIAKFVIPRLEHLMANTHGYPSHFQKKFGKRGAEVWGEYMDEMLWALEQVADQEIALEDEAKRIQKGLRKFGFWFQDLWD